MEPIRVFIPIDPVPKARPRFTRRGHVYTPVTTRNYEDILRWKMKDLISSNNVLYTMALCFTIRLFIRKPDSVKRYYPSVRPDIDNYVKAVLDACNGVVYKDDGQIISLTVSKAYADVPGVEILIQGRPEPVKGMMHVGNTNSDAH
jgi:Holliday junction resolvase RusA-like endonuclease